MQVVEFAKGDAAWALGVVVTPESPEAFAQELRLMKEALLDWKAKRQQGCALVMFTVVTAPANHEAIRSLLARVYDEEAELAPFLRSLEVQVALLNAEGRPFMEYVLGAKPAVDVGRRKPWWKVW